MTELEPASCSAGCGQSRGHRNSGKHGRRRRACRGAAAELRHALCAAAAAGAAEAARVGGGARSHPLPASLPR